MFGCTLLLKNNYAQTMKDSFESILETSNGEPILIETVDGTKFVNKISTDFLNEIIL